MDTADYAGLTINGNTLGSNNLDLVTSMGAGLSIPLTLNYPDTHSVVNTGAATSVEATASGDVIGVTSPDWSRLPTSSATSASSLSSTHNWC